MKKIIIALMMTVSVQAFSKADSLAHKEKTKYSKVATVNGMVCAFCANSLEKKFKKNKAVKSIDVDLENKRVNVKFKKGKTIADKKLKKMIKASGFKVVSIDDYKPAGLKEKVDKK